MMYDEMSVLGFLLGVLPVMSLSMILGIAAYVLSALGLYTVAKRRAINNPWLAWIPVADSWILGSLSDQYRYVVRGENRSKRKSLLTLGILMALAVAAEIVLFIVMMVAAVNGAIIGDAQTMNTILGLTVGVLGLSVVMLAISVAYAIIRYMALYDVYRSLDPSNAVLYLVLSILFNVTEPFFLFFNRNKDLGMPPRREAPVYTSAEPWETV